MSLLILSGLMSLSVLGSDVAIGTRVWCPYWYSGLMSLLVLGSVVPIHTLALMSLLVLGSDGPIGTRV